MTAPAPAGPARESVARALWQPITSAPRDGTEVILLLGETIPARLDVRAGGYITGDEADNLGYREYAKYGCWMIWHSDGGDWFMVDADEPRGWVPMPVMLSATQSHGDVKDG